MGAERSVLRVLFVEDSPDDVELIRLELRRAGFDIVHERVETAEEMRRALERAEWDLILSDFSMPRFSGPDALKVIQESGLDIPFIIISGTIGEEIAVESLKAGAEDFLVKGRLHRLVPAIERGLREAADRGSRRRAEESLRENERLLIQAQKMEAIGRLAGGVAHDFNNLLTVILGRAEMLLGEVPEPGHGDLLEIVRAARRGADLTRQLLAFGRRQPSVPRVIELNTVVDECRRMIQRLLREDIRVDVELGAAPSRVQVDPGQIEQILMNLAVNAGDAMPQGGRLEIQTGRTDQGRVLLRVADDGPGMTPEVRERAFEPFFTTKDETQGTGLGLAIVYGIVQQNEGEIALESEPGRGTEFRIVFPAAEPESEGAAEGSADGSTPPVSGSGTILVVEDEEGVRSFIRRVLSQHGYEVLEAPEGREGLRVAAEHPGRIDLLLTDVVLPGMGGAQLAGDILASRPDIAILFMSGHHDDPRVSEKVSAREVGFLAKPFTFAQLLSRVTETVGSRRG